MKKIFIPLALTLFATGTIFTGCESSAQKVENAEENVANAQVKLDQARIDSAAEYEKAKVEWAQQIANNDKTLADYKIKIANEKSEQKAKDEAKLDELQKRNDGMKAKMSEYKEDGKDAWANFKTDFNKGVADFDEDMTEFGNSLANLGKK
jgi:hypothetical protein